MPDDRQRILELALEMLEMRKKRIDDEIAVVTRQLRKAAMPTRSTAGTVARARTHSRFTAEERARRSERMKSYWEKWRKSKPRRK